MPYKITLITPVYNAEITLEMAFESARAQTLGFENIEYILADDASTDGSGAMIDAWAAEYPNVRAIHLAQNSGAAGAPRNAALDMASAPYVMFLDSDDALFEGACLALYEAAERTRADIVAGLRGPDDESRRGREAARRLCKDGERVFTTPQIESMSRDMFWVFGADFWSKIYRREIIERANLRFPEGVVLEDVVFLMLYMARCESAAVVLADIIKYTLSGGSLSHGGGESFYIGIARAAVWGAERAKQLGAEARYAGYLEQLRCVEWYCECLCREGNLSRGELETIIAAWEPLFRYAAERFELDGPEGKLIARSLASGGREAALEALLELREVYKKLARESDGRIEDMRAHYERQLGDIFSSTTWKLASAAQKLALWKK